MDNVASEYKHMGVTLQANLKWNQPKHEMIVKARRQMERHFGQLQQLGYLGVQTMMRLWQTMLRPMLEYGAEVWRRCTLDRSGTTADECGQAHPAV